MGFLDLFKRETRDRQTVRASDPYLAEFFGQHGVAGFRSNEHAAGLSVAQACIRLICETLASVPLKARRWSENGGSAAASDHPLYGVLQDSFREGLTAFAGREWMIAELLVSGNAYARIERNGRGQVIGLHPLPTNTTTVEQLRSGRLRYKVNSETFLEEEVLHLRHRTRDGVMGMSPIAVARETYGLALTQRDQAASQSSRAFASPGALVFPGHLSIEGAQGARMSFEDRFIGATKANNVMVLDGGAKFERFAFSSVDAEFLESRKLSNLDVCRTFGVPPSAIGITDDATYSNIGEESRALVVRCLAPLARRIEQAMNAALLTAESRKALFIEHDLQGLLRGDMAARYEAYRIGREGEWLSANDVRDLENMSKIDGGDEYVSPSHRAGATRGEGN